MNSKQMLWEFAITDSQVRNWFSKIRSGDTSLRDELRPDVVRVYDYWQPSPKLVFKVSFWRYVIEMNSDQKANQIINQDTLRKLVEYNLRKNRELALDLNTYQFTICRHLKKIKVSKSGIWLLNIL